MTNEDTGDTNYSVQRDTNYSVQRPHALPASTLPSCSRQGHPLAPENSAVKALQLCHFLYPTLHHGRENYSETAFPLYSFNSKMNIFKISFFFFPSVNSEKLWHRVKCIRFHPSLVPIPAPSWEPLLWLRAEGLRLWWIKHSKLQSTHTQTDKENYKYRTGHYGESRDQVHKTGEK